MVAPLFALCRVAEILFRLPRVNSKDRKVFLNAVGLPQNFWPPLWYT